MADGNCTYGDRSVIMEISNHYPVHLELPWYRSVVLQEKKKKKKKWKKQFQVGFKREIQVL